MVLGGGGGCTLGDPAEFSAMAVDEQTRPAAGEGKVWGFFKSAFRNGSTASSSSPSMNIHPHGGNPPIPDGSHPQGANSVSSVAKSLLPTRRRLKLDPPTKLYFPCKVPLLLPFSTVFISSIAIYDLLLYF